MSLDDVVARVLREHAVASTPDALPTGARALLERDAARAGVTASERLAQVRAEQDAYLVSLDASSAANALALEVRNG